MNKLNVEWVVKDGGIFTKALKTLKTEGGKLIKVPEAIAFNVGSSAEHIVKLHNDHLRLLQRN